MSKAISQIPRSFSTKYCYTHINILRPYWFGYIATCASDSQKRPIARHSRSQHWETDSNRARVVPSPRVKFSYDVFDGFMSLHISIEIRAPTPRFHCNFFLRGNVIYFHDRLMLRVSHFKSFNFPKCELSRGALRVLARPRGSHATRDSSVVRYLFRIRRRLVRSISLRTLRLEESQRSLLMLSKVLLVSYYDA